ncbi:hypothetical protein M9H77_12113 [Catharanthus roseus]|uniref:Uncharacterized protein n=1 Tax=Catharanthus roseus TaxID=4058 RepID=A0ACC0BGE3_CATRO|nr:hypothetical protein M9H77_12113 [Catharanthus roseus]
MGWEIQLKDIYREPNDIIENNKKTKKRKNDDSDFGDNALENEDVDDDLRSVRTDSPEDDEVLKHRYMDFDTNRDMENLCFELGMRFADHNQFKATLKNHMINEGRAVKFKPIEPKRVKGKCKNKECKWFMFASVEPALKTSDLVIESMTMKHNNCNHFWKNPHTTAKWVAQKYIERFGSNTKISVAAIRQTVDEDFRSQMSSTAAYNARKLALSMIFDTGEKQYQILWDYVSELKRTHPNSIMEMVHQNFREPGKNPRFMRIYCC